MEAVERWSRAVRCSTVARRCPSFPLLSPCPFALSPTTPHPTKVVDGPAHRLAGGSQRVDGWHEILAGTCLAGIRVSERVWREDVHLGLGSWREASHGDKPAWRLATTLMLGTEVVSHFLLRCPTYNAVTSTSLPRPPGRPRRFNRHTLSEKGVTGDPAACRPRTALAFPCRPGQPRRHRSPAFPLDTPEPRAGCDCRWGRPSSRRLPLVYPASPPRPFPIYPRHTPPTLPLPRPARGEGSGGGGTGRRATPWPVHSHPA